MPPLGKDEILNAEKVALNGQKPGRIPVCTVSHLPDGLAIITGMDGMKKASFSPDERRGMLFNGGKDAVRATGGAAVSCLPCGAGNPVG